MNESKLAFSVPVADGRDWFRFDSRNMNWVPCKTPGNSQPVCYLFGATECLSIPLWINSEDPDLIPKLAVFEIERLTGQVIEAHSHRMTIRKIGRKESHTLVHATIIGDLPEEYLKRNWQGFSAHPFFIEPHRNRLHLWEEDGRWVAGFFLQNLLTHWHAFGKGDLTEGHITELHCLVRDLLTRSICSSPESIVIHADAPLSTMLAQTITDKLDLSILYYKTDRSKRFRQPSTESDLEPQSLVDFRAQLGKIRQRYAIVAFLVCSMIGAFSLGWFQLHKLDKQLKQIEQKVDQMAPIAAQIKESRDRWENLVPAFQTDQYPIEIFHRVAVLLPPKGIRLTEFEIRKRKITIRAEASNVPTAIKFKADLERSPDLTNYQWQVPPPQISGDTAKFVAFGIPSDGQIANNP